ncbi:uncharacterized protein PV09_08493 [Verruconis gallopava]|uniref:Heterokaryon incompatibility domain-containing protein n=1 Tax=Verruconis gallopava TaxID=253628 RepID=A0A0D1ZZF8_9PEZI|nr:uncharacterized protein PV09_08493 [Verruconis gallopava]KIV99822.1 hypothetical protein PV09_08493 [Verruconis gallopava]
MLNAVSSGHVSEMFRYAPLSLDHFRLLQILPGKGGYDDEVECVIDEYPLAQRTTPEYVALSYTWGDREGGSIGLNGRRFEVGFNLQDSLKALRFHNVGRYVWIDAICINQDDFEERKTQVARMNEVYTLAVCVAVCLTPESGEEETGIVDESYRTFAEYRRHWKRGQLTDFSGTAGQDSARMYNSVSWLAGKSYFSRLWIVQENVLAKKRVLICRKHKTPWLHVRFMVGEAVARPPQGVDQTAFATKVLRSGLEQISRIEANKQSPGDLCATGVAGIKADSTPAEVLWWTMNLYRGQRCKDARDRVYGMLGLPQLQHHAIRSALAADYEMSNTDLFAYLVVWLEKNGPIKRFGSRENSPLVRWCFLQNILEVDVGAVLATLRTNESNASSRPAVAKAWHEIKGRSYSVRAYYQGTVKRTSPVDDVEEILRTLAQEGGDEEAKRKQSRILQHMNQFHPTADRTANSSPQSTWAQIECNSGAMGYANPATRPGDVIVHLFCDYTPNNTAISTSVMLREEADSSFIFIGPAASAEALASTNLSSSHEATTTVQKMPSRRAPPSEKHKTEQKRLQGLHVALDSTTLAAMTSPDACRSVEATWRPKAGFSARSPNAA